MQKSEAEGRLHPLLRTRSSPRVFDTAAAASLDDVRMLVEAARWAPSAGNSQPWAFIIARRGE
ncbi:MAG: nitroreductase family protein, partial [Streptosporangiales bacterium]